MGITYNPFIGNFDFSGASSGIGVGTPVAGSTPHSILVVDASSNLDEVGPLTDGQLLIGSTGNAVVPASLTGTSNQITVTPGPGSVLLSLPQNINTAATPTFTTVIANLDKAGSLDIGATNATTVNIGSGASVINILNNLNANSHRITNLLDPSSAQDAMTLAYAGATYIPLAQKGANNGVATLDSGGKIPVGQLPNSVMELQGFWNVTTNTPTLADGVGNPGDVYEVSVAGTINLGSGAITFAVGDWAVYAADNKWHKSINSNEVTSVNGQTGTVILDTDDIGEGAANLYFTTSRVEGALTGAISSILTVDLTANRAVISNGSGKIAVSTVTDTELSYVSGVTSAIQTQLNAIPGSSISFTNKTIDADLNTITNIDDGNIKTGAAINATKISNGVVSNTEFDYLDGVTSSIQDQLDSKTTTPTGDIAETNFVLSQSVGTFTNVTGLLFPTASIGSFFTTVRVDILADTNLSEVFSISGVQNNGVWVINHTSVGDTSGVLFDINNSGQIQYKSDTYTGFVSGSVRFRAQSLNI